MAKPTAKKGGIANLKPWPKGQSGNPAGRPPKSEEMKALEKLTRAEVEELGGVLLNGDWAALERIAKRKEGVSVLKRWFAKAALKAARRGDFHVLKGMIEMLIGKRPIRLEHDLAGTLEDLVAGSWKEKGGDGD